MMDETCYTSEGYIDWQRILSKDAPYNLIIDARTRGKTFGLRYQCALRDYPKRHKRFVELTRTAEQLKGSDALQVGYYDKLYSALAGDRALDDWMLDTRGRFARIARRPDEGKKPKWDTLGYFLALTDAGNIKNRSNSFADVRRFIFDEALLDRSIDRMHDYLPGEIAAVASIMTSVSRERPDTPDTDRPRLYLLGNAVDLSCPWLAHFGITDVPPYGFSWHYDHRCLVWYGRPDTAWAAAQDASVSGGLVVGTAQSASGNLNEFSTMDASYFGAIPPKSDFAFGVVWHGERYGVWCDMAGGHYYVEPKLPKDTRGRPVYALTADDARPNYIIARRAQRSLRGFVDLYYMGVVRYKDHATRAGFLRALGAFGIR